MESTFLSVAMSNYTFGIVSLIIFLVVISVGLYLAYIVYIWSVIPVSGLLLMNVYMLIIWVNPTLDTSKTPINWIGIIGFILLIAGTIACVVLNQIRLQDKLDKAEAANQEIEEKRVEAINALDKRSK